MSSTLRVITNSLGSNDRTIITYDGDVYYDGNSRFTTQYMFNFLTNVGPADINHFDEMTDEDFDNWENIVYE